MHSLQTAGVRFIDPEFPPTPASLWGGKPSAKATCWRRAGEFLKPGFAVFEGGIQPDDISQGQLGDCWLMCSLSAIAEFPDLVTECFKHDGVVQADASGVGLYFVR